MNQLEKHGITLDEAPELYLDLMYSLIEVQRKNGKLKKMADGLDYFAARFFHYYEHGLLSEQPLTYKEKWWDNVRYQARGFILNGR